MSSRISRILLLLLTFLTPLACRGGEAGAEADARAASATSVQVDSSFAVLVERLSEPGGYFDTDNLISNETSYLHVIGELEELGVSGGAYIGVGPDQNFSYIAHVRPRIAFIIDIRRDNLLKMRQGRRACNHPFVRAQSRPQASATHPQSRASRNTRSK